MRQHLRRKPPILSARTYIHGLSPRNIHLQQCKSYGQRESFMDERQWNNSKMAGTHSRRGSSVLPFEFHHPFFFRYAARHIHWPRTAGEFLTSAWSLSLASHTPVLPHNTLIIYKASSCSTSIFPNYRLLTYRYRPLSLCAPRINLFSLRE